MDETSSATSVKRSNRAVRVSESEEEVEQDLDDESEVEKDMTNEERSQGNGESHNPEESSKGSNSSQAVGNGSNDQLEAFRQQWQIELQQKPEGQGQNHGDISSANDNVKLSVSDVGNAPGQLSLDPEDEARAYFIQGMEAEDDGMLSEAIYYYRKALQLVPDIESKLGTMFNRSPRDRVRQDSESSVEGTEPESVIEGLDKLKLEEEGLCQMEYEQRMTHISCLPVELVIYILHWVVSNDLDLRSLEMVAMVCKGFYMCARDERVWKKACKRVWGLNLGSSKKYGSSWRRMMLERPHLLFDGCYISKVTYVRQGEQSMDSFYRPFHLVEYFRYLRFFPDGQVLMLVSPEDPLQSLPKLINRNSKAPGILKGGYRLSDTKVTCILKRVLTESHSNMNTYRYKWQQRQANNQPDVETCYVVECNVVSCGRRSHAQLVWESYSIRNVSKHIGEEVRTQFDLNKRTFPPLIFSRVKSFTSTSTEPLT